MEPNYITIDIETIPTQKPEVIESLKAQVAAPAQYKKPESIEQWIKENGEQVANEIVAKTSFNGGLGEVFCIGLAEGNGDPHVIRRNDLSPEAERQMLIEFNFRIGALVDRTLKQPFFIGHNISGFDLRFLFHRMAIHCVKPAFVLPVDDAAWKASYFDTMCAWAGFKERVKLVDLCAYLGISSSKGDLDGSKVWEYVQAGRWQEIYDYCAGDVAVTREIYKRITFQ